MKFIRIKEWLFNYNEIESIKHEYDEGIEYLYVYIKGDGLYTEIENASFSDIKVFEVIENE